MSKISYYGSDGTIEFVIRDEAGAKIDHFRANLKDKKRQGKILNTLNWKYGILSVSEGKKEGFFDF